MPADTINMTRWDTAEKFMIITMTMTMITIMATFMVRIADTITR